MTLAPAAVNRRHFLSRTSQGLFGVALASLLEPGLLRAAPARGVFGNLPLPQKAKRVIWLTMAGGPSHLELFDRKPKLAELDGQPMPESVTRGQQLASCKGRSWCAWAPCFRSKSTARAGSKSAICCRTWRGRRRHLPGAFDDHRGDQPRSGTHVHEYRLANRRPAEHGAWVTYGLGSEAEDLPGFVVLVSTGKGRSPQPIAARQWSGGFLPGRFQGVQLRSKGDPVLYLGRPAGVSLDQQAAVVGAINELNRSHDDVEHDPEIATRIAQYELAFQMQTSVPGLMDLAGEDARTIARYGCQPGDGSFASNCLLARRLAQRGVRFIQLYHRDWDHHSLLREELPLRRGTGYA